MKLQNDDYYEEEQGSGSKTVYMYMALIMSAVVLGVTALVFCVNGGKSKSDGSGYAAALAQKEAQSAQSSDVQTGSSESKLTSDQLDIWTLPYTGRDGSSTSSSKNNGTVTNKTTGEAAAEDSSEPDLSGSGDMPNAPDDGKTTVYDMEETEREDDAGEEDKKDDKDDKNDKEKEILTEITVKLSDGTKEVVELSDSIERNDYDYSNLTYQNPIMKYYESGKLVSTAGAKISADQGDVSFAKLKNAGCSFVMIKIGARGYSSGNIVFDANYEDNLKAAKKAGLEIGVYFCSQAVTKAEAREEADELLDAIADYDITYPIVFVMESISDDMARTEALDVDGRTSIAKAFMDSVEAEGYTAAIYGDLEYLLTMVDMERLDGYDVWYAQDADEPDYPYEFTMWQYDSDAGISGISGDVALIISFKDYSD